MTKFKLIPRVAWGEGCYLDYENNRLYGADGIIYDNIQINRADLERFIEEETKRKRDR